MQKADVEIMYDKDKDIADIWRDIKKVKVEDVQNYDFRDSKALFKELLDSSPKNPVDRLFRNLYISLKSYAGMRNHFNERRGGGKTFMKRFPEFKERLKDVIVLNQDYKTVIRKYDSRKILFYLDPPYYGTNNKGYKHENIDYEEKVELLRSIKGNFILSINDDPYIRKLLKGFKVKRVKLIYDIDNGKTERYELIVRNFS